MGQKHTYAAVYIFEDETSYFDMMTKMSTEIHVTPRLVGSMEQGENA